MLAWLRAWLAHPDPRVAVANKMAALLGSNGPFYPAYVLIVAGWAGMPRVLLTMWACPVFLAVPWIARRQPLAARVMLMAVSTVNVVFCTWLLGERSGVELFLIPCVTLAAMLFRAHEIAWLGFFLVLPLASWWGLHGRYAAPLFYDDAALDRLFAMNAFSVGCLSIAMGWMIANEREPPVVRRDQTM